MKNTLFIWGRWIAVLFGLILFFPGCGEPDSDESSSMISLEQKDMRPKDDARYAAQTRDDFTRQVLTMDFDRIQKPNSLDAFTSHFHHPPVRQGRTSTCWCFAATSLLESELQRMGKGKIKLSEMHTVYWEFVEKARGFIRSKGEQLFTRGSEPNALFLRMQRYGAVPASVYTGLLPEKEGFDHSAMFREMKSYLEFCEEYDFWDESRALAYIRSILNYHMGKPPDRFIFDENEITPLEYLNEALELNLDKYVSFISFLYLPFYTQGEFKVPDNWWHSDKYYNVPLEDFYSALVKALNNGFTVALGSDVSEPGRSGPHDIAVIPTFDIHPALIDQDSREFRFSNHTSTDDHAVHAVGINNQGGHTWFLIKDSGHSAYDGRYPGYYFFRDDFIRLKMLTFTVHKDAAADLLSRFPTRR